jgi:glutamine amidotransferase-like uncharacterized protein/biotin transporter BioY
VARFVRDGGAFLGLCAGGYFASSRVEFELGTPLEVAGPRDLAFFPGAAVGAVAPGFDYGSEAGAAAMRIRFAASPAQPRASPPVLDDECVVYVNGGPAFIMPPGGAVDPAVQTLAEYENGAPAAVRCAVGAGVAVLCGPHPEMAPRWLSAGSEAGAAAVRTSVLLASLSSADSSRVRFWRALLTATGVALATQRSLSSVGPFGSASELDGEPPPSPLRTIAPGPMAPAADAAMPLLDPPLPPPAVAARRSSSGASGLGPLRACSHADLLALPHVPPLEQLVPPEEAGEGGAHPGGGAAVFVPWPRLASWLAATAALLAASRATRGAAPRIAHAAGAAAGAAALAAGASVRLGGERGGVPITAQTLSACLCGLVLGPQQGVRAAALYAAAAAAGAPVLTPHAGRPLSRGAHTASAGFVAGFALCAYAVGRASDACASRRASGPAFGATVAAAAAAAQLATAAIGGGWAACLLMAEGAAPDAACGGRPRPWLLELALASAKSVPPFVPGLLLKACITGAAAAAAAPRLRGPEPPPKPALRNLLDG